MDWTVQGSNPGGETFHTRQTGLGDHSTSCAMGTGSFPGVKRPGHDVDHPHVSSAEVKERIELHSITLCLPGMC